jgi:hypothetical protein
LNGGGEITATDLEQDANSFNKHSLSTHHGPGTGERNIDEQIPTLGTHWVNGVRMTKESLK